VPSFLDPSLPDRLREQVVGREREVEVVVAALAAGRHVLLEGPPGTGKSTLLRALASSAGMGFEPVEGNAELTPARLVGHHDPSRVLAEGYTDANWVDGPLAAAMRDGSLLYVEELNRVPEETLNVLITVMSEGELHVPRLGTLTVSPGFRLVAAMNPSDAVGTARISSAIYDRTCRVVMGYQSDDEETAIVGRAVGDVDPQGVEAVGPLVQVRARIGDGVVAVPGRVVGDARQAPDRRAAHGGGRGQQGLAGEGQARHPGPVTGGSSRRGREARQHGQREGGGQRGDGSTRRTHGRTLPDSATALPPPARVPLGHFLHARR